MEENRSLPEKKARTLEDDPQYFGGYLNMARLNIYNINNHLAPKFNQAVLREEGDIPDSIITPKS